MDAELAQRGLAAARKPLYSRCRTLQPLAAADLSLRDCFANAVGVAIQALGVGSPARCAKMDADSLCHADS